MITQMKNPTTLTRSEKDNKKQRLMVAGLLAGAAVGATVALILWSNKNNSIKQKANSWFSSLLENSKEKLGSVKNIVKPNLAKVKV